MSEKLFVYGTLMQSKVQQNIIGRVLKNSPDVLLGFRKSNIKIGNEIYPIIIKDLNSDEKINGLILEVEKKDFKILDEYEGKEYKRKKVILNSGILVWVYQK